MTSLLERSSKSAGTAGRSEYRLPAAPRGRRPTSSRGFRTVGPGQHRRVRQYLLLGRSPRAGPGGHRDHRTGRAHHRGRSWYCPSGQLWGVGSIPGSSADELAGSWAAVTIPAGSLLTQGDVTASRPVPGRNAVVGLALKPGQLPSSGLVPGDKVMVVQTLGAGAVLPLSGTVEASGTSTGTGGVPGDTGIPSSTGVLVAQAAVFQPPVHRRPARPGPPNWSRSRSRRHWPPRWPPRQRRRRSAWYCFPPDPAMRGTGSG